MSSVPPHRSDNDGPQPHLVISTHDPGIWTLAYLPDGRILSGSEDGTVTVWNLEGRKQERTSMEHESGIRGLAVTRDGANIISSDEYGEIKVWDVESHEIVEEWSHPENYPRIAISPDARLIAAGAWTVTIYNMESRRVKHSIDVGSRVWSLSFSPDGKKLACGTNDDIRVYGVDSGRLLVGPLEDHQDWICDVLWSRDGSWLFSGSDSTVRCWDSYTGAQIGHSWTGHTGNILSLSLSSDGLILASASWDKTIRFWDARTGNPIGQHLQHDKRVRTVLFSPSGEFVASAIWDGKIYLWRVPWLDSITHQVITPFLYVLALILTVMVSQARPILPGTECVLRGVDPLASVFLIGSSV